MSFVEPKSKVVKVSKLSVVDFYEMYKLFAKYYDNTDLETFTKDINKKDDALLMRDTYNGRIVGFSTIALLNMRYKGRKAIGVFSGDTILEKEYWGSRRWKLTWALHMLSVKTRNPSALLFWLLISKGYKTYMLMANNFPNYYPRLDRDDASLAAIVDDYCGYLFPDHYDKKTKILDFGDKYQYLRDGVAEIDEALKASQPKIRFFEKCNPEWRRGTELPCVAKLEVVALFPFLEKLVKGRLGAKKRRTASAKRIRAISDFSLWHI